MTVLTLIVGAFTFWRTVSAVFYVFTIVGFVLAGITFCFMLYSMFNKAIYGACMGRAQLNDFALLTQTFAGAMFTLVFTLASPIIYIGVLVRFTPTMQQGAKYPFLVNLPIV